MDHQCFEYRELMVATNQPHTAVSTTKSKSQDRGVCGEVVNQSQSFVAKNLLCRDSAIRYSMDMEDVNNPIA